MLLSDKGTPEENRWQYAAEDTPLPAGAVIVPLARLAEALARDNAETGVLLAAGDDIRALKDALPALSLIVVSFPVFRDGRAFTQARALREHLHYTGEIRATGHILPDQYDFLIRCGVTSAEVPDGSDVTVWQKALHQFQVALQPSVLNEKPTGFGLRRFLSA